MAIWLKRVEGRKALEIISDMENIVDDLLNRHTTYGGREVIVTVKEEVAEELRQGLSDLKELLGGE